MADMTPILGGIVLLLLLIVAFTMSGKNSGKIGDNARFHGRQSNLYWHPRRRQRNNRSRWFGQRQKISRDSLIMNLRNDPALDREELDFFVADDDEAVLVTKSEEKAVFEARYGEEDEVTIKNVTSAVSLDGREKLTVGSETEDGGGFESSSHQPFS